MNKIIVIGGGPAGMMAAYHAAGPDTEVLLLEKNEKLGKKLFITGKGRCNITNASDMDTLFANITSNPKFLYSAFYEYTNDAVMDFFKAQGLALKIERGNRVFPESDHSSDVIAACRRALEQRKVEVRLHTTVKDLLIEEDKICGVILSDNTHLSADAVIVATGGLSYPSTGSTGDGYRFAEKSGHALKEQTPALVPINTKEAWVPLLQGLSLKNTGITIYDGNKKLYSDFGEMLFTHFGVSGPMILSASACIKPALFAHELMLYIDLKPALDLATLDKRILKEFEAAKNKSFKNSITGLFPSKLIPVMIELSEISPDKKVNEISREERQRFASLIKRLPVTLTGLRGFNEAIITKGGVSVKNINPSTMESKKVKGLYFCGEVLDLDAMTGGYNLQIAWSTGYLAGSSAKL